MIKHIFRISLGIVLIIIGIIGIFLPLIPGILLIFLGISVMLENNPKVFFREIAAKAKEKYQKRYVKEEEKL